MIELEHHIKLTAKIIDSPNITGEFSERDLKTIGLTVLEGYTIDDTSRERWKKRYEAAMNLALQLQETKSFPWAGASNVKFPLVTIAAIQWHSRAYPLLVQGPDIVKMNVFGPDPDGKLQEKADRVSSYMSYQLLEESTSWEEETDRALLQIPIVGCAFKKTYRSGNTGTNVSELVSAMNFVVNYYAKSIDAAQRKTHIIPLYRNDVYEKCAAGVWRDVCSESWYTGLPQQSQTVAQMKSDRRTGAAQPARPDFTTPFTFLEQHVRLDLDGDGYAEPYAITIEENSGCVCRIVCNFRSGAVFRESSGPRSKIVRIKEEQVFTKLPFMPSPDGGFYDIGFGVLLGPINASVDSIINQLIDSGTLSTTAGGFLGRGAKLRSGDMSFRPFGWQRVDSTGEDLSKSIFPLPVREPSMVLFQLLGLLVDYTNRVSGSTDIMVGENPGQNTPAATSRLMAEQGMKINTAIFKRVWRGMKEELQKLYLLNRLYTPVTVLRYGNQSGWIRREDFQMPEEAVRPAADPSLASDGQRAQIAMTLKEFAMATPGYDRDEVERMVLRAMKVENIDKIFTGTKNLPPQKDPRVALEEVKGQNKLAAIEATNKAQFVQKMAELEATQRVDAAQIANLEAQTAAIISEIGAARAATQVKAFEAQISALQAMHASRQGYMKLLQESMQGNVPSGTGAAGPGPAAPDVSGTGEPPLDPALQGGAPVSDIGAPLEMGIGGVPPGQSQ